MERFADKCYFTRISKGIEWVPLMQAGKPQYTEKEISLILSLNPQQKRNCIHTICDAINLFIKSEFYEQEDTIKKLINNELGEWEFHKSGYEAIVDNCGSCASVSSALLYLLEDDFDEVGYICFIRPNGGGHVFNYLKKEQFYYIIDPSTYMSNYIAYSVNETGSLVDYRKRKYFTNGLHRVKNVEDYINYFLRYLHSSNVEFFFCYYKKKTDYCMPIQCIEKDNCYEVSMPQNYNVKTYKGNSDKFTVCYVNLLF